MLEIVAIGFSVLAWYVRAVRAEIKRRQTPKVRQHRQEACQEPLRSEYEANMALGAGDE